jgi:hypothetical protein
MNPFIELHDVAGNAAYINVNTIIKIEAKRGCTELVTNGTSSVITKETFSVLHYTEVFPYTIYVIETPEQILELIQGL